MSLGWFSSGSPTLVELEFGALAFAEGGKLENPEKNLGVRLEPTTNSIHL